MQAMNLRLEAQKVLGKLKANDSKSTAHNIIKTSIRWLHKLGMRLRMHSQGRFSPAQCTSVVFVTQDPVKFRGFLPLVTVRITLPQESMRRWLFFHTHNLLTRFVTYQWPVTSPSVFGQNIMTLPAYLCPPMCEQGLTDTWPWRPCASISSLNFIIRAGPQAPHRRSRLPWQHTNMYEPVKVSGVPGSHSVSLTSTSSTKVSTSKWVNRLHNCKSM